MEMEVDWPRHGLKEGDRIRLVRLVGEGNPLAEPGDTGEVVQVTRRTLMIAWDKGGRFALFPGMDQYEEVGEPEQEE